MIESTGYNSSEENVINTLISSLILLQHWHTYIYIYALHAFGRRERERCKHAGPCKLIKKRIDPREVTRGRKTEKLNEEAS